MSGHLPGRDIVRIASILKGSSVVLAKDIGLYEADDETDPIFIRFKNWGYSV